MCLNRHYLLTILILGTNKEPTWRPPSNPQLYPFTLAKVNDPRTVSWPLWQVLRLSVVAVVLKISRPQMARGILKGLGLENGPCEALRDWGPGSAEVGPHDGTYVRISLAAYTHLVKRHG